MWTLRDCPLVKSVLDNFSYFRFASYTEIGSLQKCSRMNVSTFLEFYKSALIMVVIHFRYILN